MIVSAVDGHWDAFLCTHNEVRFAIIALSGDDELLSMYIPQREKMCVI